MEKTEILVLKNLIYNEDYVRKILPYLKQEYFQDYSQRVVFQEIEGFFVSYNQLPTKEALEIEIENRNDLNEGSYKEVIQLLKSFDYEPVEFTWLCNTTEKWCRDRAIYLALMESIQIADGNDSNKNRDAIPSILQEALSVSFDTHIGHDYIEDVESRYEFYHRKESKIPFDLDYFNKITDGGVSPKTLNLVVAPPGVGKSLFLCHFAASTLIQGKNVLYITLEMAEERIAERIDANLLDVSVQDIPKLSKEKFLSKTSQLSKKTQGKLIIKEYPVGTASASHFKVLLKELEMKKNFIPDIIVIDYLNLCASARYKTNGTNSYTYVKSISEEIRGLGVEYNIPILSAIQFNRCLGLDTIITKKSGNQIKIKDVKVGDEILSHSGYVEVKEVYPIETQEVYEITTKSGKKIICSDKHIFPTTEGEKNILTGLTIGDKLFVNTKPQISQDEIVSIKKVGEKETIDINVSGDNLFFANDILTHNSGSSTTDASLEDVSDSYGIAFTADMLIALVSTEELEQMNQILVKQLKNRYAPLDRYRKFVVGIDRSKMRLYNTDQSAQEDLIDVKMNTDETQDFKSKFKSFNYD